MKNLKNITSILIFSLLLCLTGCDLSGDSDKKSGAAADTGIETADAGAVAASGDAAEDTTTSSATPATSSTSSSGATKIVVIGDSIGAGFGGTTGFPGILKSISGATVINNSKDGRMTSSGVGLARSLIAEHKPTHLVVLLGTNDAIRGSASGAISNLQSIANIAKAAGVTAVIGTLPRIPRDAEEDANAARISSGIQGLGNARIASGIRSEVGTGNFIDGVHPDNNGQRIIAMNFAERI